MYNLYIGPSSKYDPKPNKPRRGLGTITPVPPAYAMSSGREANNGNTNFTLQGMSNTSSAKPRNNMKHMVAKAAL